MGRLFFWAFSPLLPWRPRVVNNFFSVLFLERDSSRGQFRVNHLSPPSPSRKKRVAAALCRRVCGKREEATFFPKYFLGQKKRGRRKEKWGKSLSLSSTFWREEREGEREREIGPFRETRAVLVFHELWSKTIAFWGKRKGGRLAPEKRRKKWNSYLRRCHFRTEKRSPSLPPFSSIPRTKRNFDFFPPKPSSREGEVTRAMTTGDFERRGG